MIDGRVCTGCLGIFEPRVSAARIALCVNGGKGKGGDVPAGEGVRWKRALAQQREGTTGVLHDIGLALMTSLCST